MTELRTREETRCVSEAQFRLVQEHSPDGFTILRPLRDAEGRVIDFTWVYEHATVARLHGPQPNAVLGRRLLDLYPSHRGSQILRAYQEVAESGKRCIFEADEQRDDLRERTWFRIVVMPAGGDIAIVAQDITGQKQAEESLRLRNRALRMSSECQRALVRATAEEALLQAICRIAVEDGGYRSVWVGFAEQNEAKSVRPVAQAGFKAGYLDTFNITWADTERGRGPVGAAIRTSRPVIARDNPTDPNYGPWCVAAAQRGVTAFIALPLTAGEHTFGGLMICSEEPDAFGAEELALLGELAANLAYGVATLRMRDEQDRVGKALGHSQAMLEAVTEGTPDAVFVKDARGRYLMANAGTLKLLGKSLAEVIGADDTALFPLEEARQLMARDRRVMDSVAAQTDEEFVTVLGQPRTFLSVKGPWRDAQGSVMGVFGIGRDITARKQAEAERDRLFDHMTEGLAYCRMIFADGQPQDFQYLKVNEAFTRLTGLRDVVGKRVSAVIPGSLKTDPELFAAYGRVASTGQPERMELFVKALHKWVSLSIYSPAPEHFVEIFSDITEQKQAEAALRSIALQLTQAQEAERRRIARELHDSAGQKLASLSITVGMLKDAIDLPDERTEKMFTGSLAMIEQCAQEIRTQSYLLHPPLLDELGLAAAISDYVAGFEKRRGLRIMVEVTPGLKRWPDGVELALFRVIQESLGNIHRHARTTSARLRLICDAEQITLEIMDEGVGIPPAVLQGIQVGRGEMGIGIVGMRERLRLLGGRLEILSGGRGTTVRAIVPRRNG